MDEVLRGLLRRFGRPSISPAIGIGEIDEFDERLAVLEREQREIDARLRLLEQQADPRGIRRERHGG